MKKIFLVLVSSVLLFAQSKTLAFPLIDAVLKKDINSVQVLLKKGVDKSIKDDKGFSALDYAISRKYSEIAQILYSDNLNNFIFLKEDGEPLYVAFSKDGFKFKNKKRDDQIVVLGTITPESFKEVCQSYSRSKKNTLDLRKKRFHLFLVASRVKNLVELNNIKGDCKKFSTFLYPNYKFYQFLERLFKYQGVPQLLFRDKSGKVTGGSIESYIFEGNNGFIGSMK